MPTLLRIAGTDWDLELEGSLPVVSSSLSERADTTIESSSGVSIHSLDVTSNVLKERSPREAIPPLLFESVRYHIYLSGGGEGAEFVGPTPVVLRHTMRTGSGVTRHYELEYRNLVGYTDLEIASNAGRTSIRLEVFPRKLDYRSDYVAMRDEIAGVCRQLVMALHRATFGLALATPEQRPTLNEWLSLLETYFDKLWAAVTRIGNDPISRIETSRRMVTLDRARRLTRNDLAQAMRSGGRRRPVAGSRVTLPERISETTRQLTLDTPENRHVKYLLTELRFRLQQMLRLTPGTTEDVEPTAEKRFLLEARPFCERLNRRLTLLLASRIFRTVSAKAGAPNALSLHLHPAYARVGQLSGLINSGLSISGGPLRIGLKQVSLLYEYWCFLKLVDLLGERFPIKRSSVVRLSRTRVSINLVKGRESTVTFTDPTTGRTFDLTYNRLFSSLPTLAQQPDNVIELGSGGDLYVFDAKYRVDAAPDYVQQHGSIGPTTDDVNVMHRYRDAIVISASPEPGFKSIVRGAIALFPFADEEEYERNRFFRSIAAVEIGGLPFLPSATALVRQQLDLIVSRYVSQEDTN